MHKISPVLGSTGISFTSHYICTSTCTQCTHTRVAAYLESIQDDTPASLGEAGERDDVGMHELVEGMEGVDYGNVSLLCQSGST